MPSIPQSLLWISLVVLWLFVLVPMLISKRDAVRRTSDLALATRVLNTGAGARLLKRGGPAAGHRHDPDWQPEADGFDGAFDDGLDDGLDGEGAVEAEGSPSRSVAVRVATASAAEPDYLDVDVIDEDSGALPVGTSRTEAGETGESEAAGGDPEVTDVIEVADVDRGDDEYEYVEDTSGLEAEADPPTTLTPSGASRRRRYDTNTAAAVVARKYQFRKRVLLAMASILLVSAVAAFTVAPGAWWMCGTAATGTVLYLAYLRRQTRIEERVRRRRMQRMARSRLGVENTGDREFDVVPARLRRPGAAVLEIDDEDPAFEHLDYVAYARDYNWSPELLRAAGQ